MARLKLNPTSLSRVSGVPQPTIHRIVKGEVVPDTSTLRKLAPHLNVTLEALVADNPPEQVGFIKEQGAYPTNIGAAPKSKRAVPVIALIRAGNMADIGALPEPGQGDRWESPDERLGVRGWAHIVEGDSMDDGTDKAVPEGWLIFVDPDLSPQAGDYVIAKDVATQQATFKKLSYDGGRWYLKPLNRQYQAIEIDSPELRVIGVVTEARAPSRKLR